MTRSSKSTGKWTMSELFCSNSGFKNKKKQNARKYEKLVERTDCTTYVQFSSVGNDGVWTVVKHNMIHNHEMIPLGKRHLLRSQRKVADDQLKFMTNMKNCGIRVPNILHVIRNKVGGSPNMAFTTGDAYNALSTIKANKLEGGDCNQLMKYFAKRQARESDFYYEFEVDGFGSLCNIFW
ncbi:protein FAR1-RELATED SEQUENCE 3-like [Chenopodium quinoa]|uniref:protein FAR1-RELATED SEQUENCE 3-like n=1 Tax=Chenopodium quinoa TaxID=63459 RepID=UPI000B797AEE|nr:protein FAR1-RELATED SEQUENCE 3-like [Chenopodium quinoa]